MGKRFVQICAILIVLRAFSNFAELLQGEDAVLVFFGQILRGDDVSLPAAVVGAFMLVTGIGMLMQARRALPMIAIYATFVAVNLAAWTGDSGTTFFRAGSTLIS